MLAAYHPSSFPNGFLIPNKFRGSRVSKDTTKPNQLRAFKPAQHIKSEL